MQGGCNGWVALPVQLLVEFEGQLVVFARLGQVPLVKVDCPKAAEGFGDVFVPLPVQLLGEFEGSLEELARPR